VFQVGAKRGSQPESTEFLCLHVKAAASIRHQDGKQLTRPYGLKRLTDSRIGKSERSGLRAKSKSVIRRDRESYVDYACR
jgi:hypothetical protein